MMLTEVTAVPGAALPVEALKEHLRLGSGFALAPAQDGLLESHLRAAISVIEGRTAKALLERRFEWALAGWRDPVEQALPLGPVARIAAVTLVASDGGQTVVSPDSYRLEVDLHRPRLVAAGMALPLIPTGGRGVIAFDAGFGLGWTDVPADLRQAVLLLAAEFYEHRHDDGSGHAGLPFAVATLIERWRAVRLLGGRGRR